MRIPITHHATLRAQQRWLEPDPAAAHRAIQAVLERGEATRRGHVTTMRYGSRCVRVVDGVAVTVMLHRPHRLTALVRQVRRDLRDRRR